MRRRGGRGPRRRRGREVVSGIVYPVCGCVFGLGEGMRKPEIPEIERTRELQWALGKMHLLEAH